MSPIGSLRKENQIVIGEAQSPLRLAHLHLTISIWFSILYVFEVNDYYSSDNSLPVIVISTSCEIQLIKWSPSSYLAISKRHLL